jgi:excisionase family DNA binding protein
MNARMSDVEPLLTPQEVATMFRVDPKTVTRWAKAGKLTSVRTLGGHRRYRETEVRALLAGVPEAPVDPLAAPAVSLWPGLGGVPAPLRRCFHEAVITTVRDLTRVSARDLADLGLSPEQVDEVRLVLFRKGLALSGDVLGEVA